MIFRTEIYSSNGKAGIIGFFSLIPLFIFILYEIGWWIIKGSADDSFTLVEKDFPSVLAILSIVLLLPSFSTVCGVIMLREKTSRQAGAIMLVMTVLMVFVSVILRPV